MMGPLKEQLAYFAACAQDPGLPVIQPASAARKALQLSLDILRRVEEQGIPTGIEAAPAGPRIAHESTHGRPSRATCVDSWLIVDGRIRFIPCSSAFVVVPNTQEAVKADACNAGRGAGQDRIP